MKRVHFLSTLLTAVGSLGLLAGPCIAGDCPEDLNGDGEVNPADLARLLGAWGTCDGGGSGCGPVETQSLDTTTLDTTLSIACANLDDNFLTGIARSYSVTDYTVCTVEVGVDNTLTTANRCVGINLYDDTDGGGPESGLVLLDTVIGLTPAGFLGVVQFTLDTPITHTGTLVVELGIPETNDGYGPFLTGCNEAGETGPAYLFAPDCGVPTYTPFTDLGITQNWVQTLNGDGEITVWPCPFPFARAESPPDPAARRQPFADDDG